MNIRQSIRQTLTEARNNPAYTTLYLLGVVLAIVFTMTFSIIYFVKIAPFYPEYNRFKTYYLDGTTLHLNDIQSHSYMGYGIVKDRIYNLENAETISVTNDVTYSEPPFVGVPGTDEEFKSYWQQVDINFFRIYDLAFIEGHPFSQVEFEKGSHVAVISDRLAQRLFNSTDNAVGKEVNINHVPFKVTGVVREAPTSMKRSFAQVYVPYTSVLETDRTVFSDKTGYYLGEMIAHFKVKDSGQAELLQAELDGLAQRIQSADSTITEFSFNPVYTTTQETLGSPWEPGDWMGFIKKSGLVFLALLLVPALNLSGMISGRMEVRISEMGIRKAFGATRSSLLSQVMMENLYLTLAGGIIGLAVSWLLITLTQQWLLDLFELYPGTPEDFGGYKISSEMLFSPWIFMTVLLLCLVLNTLSGFIPSFIALRKSIVSSINEKR